MFPRGFVATVSAMLARLAYAGVNAEPGGAGFDWRSIEYVYAFGDSYTFVQGTRGHANFR